jgi:hypothetical protein
MRFGSELDIGVLGSQWRLQPPVSGKETTEVATTHSHHTLNVRGLGYMLWKAREEITNRT